jgi:hypothetical protein
MAAHRSVVAVLKFELGRKREQSWSRRFHASRKEPTRPADGRGGRVRRRDPNSSRRSSRRRAAVGLAIYTAMPMLPGKGNDRGKCWWRMFPDRMSAVARAGASQRLADDSMHPSSRRSRRSNERRCEAADSKKGDS